MNGVKQAEFLKNYLFYKQTLSAPSIHILSLNWISLTKTQLNALHTHLKQIGIFLIFNFLLSFNLKNLGEKKSTDDNNKCPCSHWL